MKEEVRWRVLPWRTDDAYTCMAIDKTIAESVAAGGPPTIRFYRWSGKGAVSFGISQTITDFDTEFCDQEGIPYVRRFTGGRVMYHGPSDLTYAIAAPLSVYSTRLPLTSDTSRWIMSFLDALGLPDVRYTGNSSILVCERKISGSAPHYEQKKAILQHGGIFTQVDYSLLSSLFRLDEGLILDRIISISEYTEMPIERLMPHFQSAFLRNINYVIGDLTEEEKERVRVLQRQYASQEWMQAGKTSLGICTVNWGVYPELRNKLPLDLQERLVDRGSE